MSDDIVFREGDIVITKTLARFGTASYPISGIGSVLIRRPSFLEYAAAILIGACIIAFGYGVLSGYWALGIVAFGAVVMGAVFALPIKLILRTASGDQQAYENQDRKKVDAVKAAIEKAITLRG